MTDQQGAGAGADFAKTMAEIAERSQRIVSEFLTRQQQGGFGMTDPFQVGRTFIDLTARMMANPAKLMQAQVDLWQDHMKLWQSSARRMMGEDGPPLAAPEPEDKRFKDPAWQENAVFDFIKQSYLLSARWLQATARDVDGLDDKSAKKIDFYTRQFVDALSPSNFVMTNPEVLRETIESKGENLVKGLKNLLEDLDRGKGQISIKMTDHTAFELGRNVAVTPGKVVFQNDLIQLIQYEPATKKVMRRPLLIIPPWINKYYILDLREKNSYVKWAVDQGITVFVVSWVNPDEKLAAKTFEDYMLEGPIAALDAMEKATGEREANVVGYCLGGTLFACALAYMAAKGIDRVTSATFLATLVDFAEPGELGVFIDEEQLAALETRMNEKGYLEGSAMANTFNMLRANDLIWSFVINNYLMGKNPFPFDLLYWNSDSTRMPAAMHGFYLRKMYQENLLSKPGGIKLAGVPIDLKKITQPSFILSTREDHIAPWTSTYAATRLYNGPIEFVLAASGHIAGIVNPPAPPGGTAKYGHWTNAKLAKTPDDWLKGAVSHEGSWWPHWAAWLKNFAGGEVAARKPGGGKLKPIEAAPGSYVRVRTS